MPPETCNFCGEEIIFRNIRGNPTPLHPKGSSCVGKTFYRREQTDICHATKCPRCSGDVYFIRHNNGSAWFDCLGAPWEKHSCFVESFEMPEGWERRIGSGWTTCHLHLIGILNDLSGGVFKLWGSKPVRRWYSIYEPQYKITRPDSDRKNIEGLDHKTVLINSNRTKVLGPGGREWEITSHTPSNRKKR